MTVTDQVTYNQYSAAAAQTIFTYTFKILDETDLMVYKRGASDAPDDVNQLLILNTDYTVTGVGIDSGGTIILSSGATLNDVVTIIRERPMERTANYLDNSALTAEALNEDFDNIMLLMQQLRTDIQKVTPKYQYTALNDTKNLKLPTLDTNELWKKEAGGIIGVELEESAGWSALRSELANDNPGTDGARLVGYYDSGLGSTTVHSALGAIQEESYAVDSGTANNYIVTLSPGPSSYYAGLNVNVKIANSNTTASTLNVNGLGAVTIKVFIDGVIADIPAGALPAGLVAKFIYDGTFFQLSNSAASLDFPVGFTALTYDTTVPSGWLYLDDGTIGSAASGATSLASAEAQALYTLLWEKVSSPTANAYCSVSGGLGASALADFTANKPLTLPYSRGRAFANYGAPTGISGYTPVLGQDDGESFHQLTVAELAAHSHVTPLSTGTGAGPRQTLLGGDTNFVSTQTSGSDTPHNTVGPTQHCSAIIKL